MRTLVAMVLIGLTAAAVLPAGPSVTAPPEPRRPADGAAPQMHATGTADEGLPPIKLSPAVAELLADAVTTESRRRAQRP